MGLPNPTKILSTLPSALRVRVSLGGVELASLATGTDCAWSGIATLMTTSNERTELGRTFNDEITVRVPLSSVSAGVPPDTNRIGIMYPGETAFSDWRIVQTRRIQTVLLTFVCEPING